MAAIANNSKNNIITLQIEEVVPTMNVSSFVLLTDNIIPHEYLPDHIAPQYSNNNLVPKRKYNSKKDPLIIETVIKNLNSYLKIDKNYRNQLIGEKNRFSTHLNNNSRKTRRNANKTVINRINKELTNLTVKLEQLQPLEKIIDNTPNILFTFIIQSSNNKYKCILRTEPSNPKTLNNAKKRLRDALLHGKTPNEQQKALEELKKQQLNPWKN